MELFYVTAKGLEYFASTATGKKLCFTKGKFGNGAYTGETSVTELTDLINPLGDMPISKNETNGNNVTITTQFSNKVDGIILNPFYLKEIGLYAKLVNADGTDDTSNPETLVAYAYAQGEDEGDRIPGVLTEFIINWPCTISNTSNVTVTVSSIAYVAQTDFDAAVLNLNSAIENLTLDNIADTDNRMAVTAEEKERIAYVGKVYTAESTDGVTYNITDDTLPEPYNGMMITLTTNTTSTAKAIKLFVNGVGGSVCIMSGDSTRNSSTPRESNWLYKGTNITVKYATTTQFANPVWYISDYYLPAIATTQKSGLMSAADKTKLDGIATGATKDGNYFDTVYVNQLVSAGLDPTYGAVILTSGGINANTKGDTLYIDQGENIEIVKVDDNGSVGMVISAKPQNGSWVANATLGDDGYTYTVTDDSIPAPYIGMEMTIIPDGASNTAQARLVINGATAARLRIGTAGEVANNYGITTSTEILANAPIRIMYVSDTKNAGATVGCWSIIGFQKIASASTTTDGLMSYTDKVNLNALSSVIKVDDSSHTIIQTDAWGAGNSTATGKMSVSFGRFHQAEGQCDFLVGESNNTTGTYDSCMGYSLNSKGYAQHVVGKFNTSYAGATSLSDNTGSIFIVGIGTSSTAKSNAFRVDNTGKCRGLQSWGSSGADYAEYYEWLDGNPDNEDRRGYFVTLEGNKIRKATADDNYILGVVSATPVVVGNTCSDMWQGMYKKDIFGEMLTETVDVPETTDKETGEVIPAHTETRFIINPEYDHTKEYISREDRQEWDAVGTHGQLVVVDDGTCEVNKFCTVSADGTATKTEEKTEFRVTERLDDNHVRIVIK